MSSTIICNSSTKADALSTITFILGLQKSLELLEKQENTDGIFITKNYEIYTTKNIAKYFTLDDESKEFKYVKKR